MFITKYSLRYVLLRPDENRLHLVSLYDQAFYFWKDSWQKVYASQNSSKVPYSDDFFRQKFVAVLVAKDEVVAIHLYSVFNLKFESIFQHSYLSENFTPHFFHQLKKLDHSSVMSMESLFVSNKFRKSLVNFSLVPVLASLGQRVFLELTNCDSIIAPARVDLGVSQIATDLGFQTIVKSVELHNSPVDLMYCGRKDVQAYPNKEVVACAEKLWKPREFVWSQKWARVG